MNITVNPDVNDIMKTKDLLFSGENRISELNDTDWYGGNVLQIKSDCRDCEEKVLIMNHVHYQSTAKYVPGCTSYTWGFDGGALQVFDAVFNLNHDGSTQNIVHFPQVQDTYCLTITLPYKAPY